MHQTGISDETRTHVWSSPKVDQRRNNDIGGRIHSAADNDYRRGEQPQRIEGPAIDFGVDQVGGEFELDVGLGVVGGSHTRWRMTVHYQQQRSRLTKVADRLVSYSWRILTRHRTYCAALDTSTQ